MIGDLQQAAEDPRVCCQMSGLTVTCTGPKGRTTYILHPGFPLLLLLLHFITAWGASRYPLIEVYPHSMIIHRPLRAPTEIPRTQITLEILSKRVGVLHVRITPGEVVVLFTEGSFKEFTTMIERVWGIKPAVSA